MSNVKLQPSRVKLRSYSGHHLSPKGQILLNVNGSDIKFQIVSDLDPILGTFLILMVKTNDTNKQYKYAYIKGIEL